MLWLILLVTGISLGGLIHLLLVVALGVMLYEPIIAGRSRGP
jgi:Family of unknown function (DUF5670)